ncbi:MAG: chromosomal replication initiator protein DnaA [Bacteroidaceae bacterium]|nr:chromosomal replication initiator protein DnaA [Bacteroidaceae bacterium]
MNKEQLSCLWNQCLDFIKDNIEIQAFNTWFTPVVPLKMEDGTLTLEVPSSFICEYIEANYADLLGLTLTKYFGENINLEYQVIVDKGTVKIDQPQHQSASDYETMLYPNYHFNNFIEGQSNKLARIASMTVAEKPGQTSFNPLFLFGTSGVGKTHLATAIGHKVLELYPEKKVVYVSAHLFHAQFVDATLKNKQFDFIKWYQDFDVLIIDDIQEFIGKDKTQNSFFHIFNHLHLNQKQIIMTSDRLPKDMLGMEERLITRFKWGLVAQIENPDFQLRKDIITYRINKDGINIDQDVVDYMAKNIHGSVRDIEGTLVALLANSTICGREIDRNLVDNILGSTELNSQKELTIEQIMDTVCSFYSLEISQIQTKSRKREVVQARQICMYIAKKYLDFSLSQIGTYIGGRDHATVLHACNTVKDQIMVDKIFRSDLQKIEESLNLA